MTRADCRECRRPDADSLLVLFNDAPHSESPKTAKAFAKKGATSAQKLTARVPASAKGPKHAQGETLQMTEKSMSSWMARPNGQKQSCFDISFKI